MFNENYCLFFSSKFAHLILIQLEKHILSKSTFLRGLQCSKSLYLYKNFIQLRDKISLEQMAIFGRGNKVGVLAQKLFPNGIDATPASRKENIKAVQRTQQLIENGTEVIYEAAFQHNGVLAILDILVKKNNTWFAYEVKSSIKISQTYLLDASLQYWVITNSGLPLQDISLITVNSQYVRKGNLNLQELFSIKSVKEDALRNQAMIDDKIAALLEVANNAQMPNVQIGEHCFSPYNCDFMGTCWKNVPANSVFEITGISKAEQFNLYNAGYQTIPEIPENNELNKNANIHIQTLKSNEPRIDKEGIAKFLDTISYPLFFMDFETFMPAVPIYNNTKPYQHIPFQYSLHYKESKDATLQHFYFLAEQGNDPRKAFIENLLKHTEQQGTILVYDALMERNVLNGLKKDFPEYATDIDNCLARMVDLMLPFQERLYYHPATKNSHSIKNLLNAIVPNLSYANLKISSGSIAMIAYEQLQTEMDMFKAMEIREQLLDYCKLDTLAMVKIFEVLEQEVS